MHKIAIIYGSSTGTCEGIAKMIASKLGVSSADMMNVSKPIPENLTQYDVLLLGSSTWGYGELQDDWYKGIEALKKFDLSGKKIGFFGCGDSGSFSDTFCDAMGLLYDDLKDMNCRMIGSVPDEDYSYSSSVAVKDGCFVGLALDEMNESEKTNDRIDNWIEIIKKEIE